MRVCVCKGVGVIGTIEIGCLHLIMNEVLCVVGVGVCVHQYGASASD